MMNWNISQPIFEIFKETNKTYILKARCDDVVNGDKDFHYGRYCNS